MQFRYEYDVGKSRTAYDPAPCRPNMTYDAVPRTDAGPRSALAAVPLSTRGTYSYDCGEWRLPSPVSSSLPMGVEDFLLRLGRDLASLEANAGSDMPEEVRRFVERLSGDLTQLREQFPASECRAGSPYSNFEERHSRAGVFIYDSSPLAQPLHADTTPTNGELDADAPCIVE